MTQSSSDGQKKTTLIQCLCDVDDPRIDRRKYHNILDILMIGVCCIISGGEGFNDMETFGKAQYNWLKTFLALPYGIPSHDTFNRVFSAINPKQFMDCFVRWTQSIQTKLGESIVAIDGKALRRAHNKDDAIPFVVGAWAAESGLTLGQVKVDDKSNEITAIPQLLSILDLSDSIVTIDAMGCQKKIARAITDAGADYVLAVKGNQAGVEKEIKAFYEELIPVDTSMKVVPQLPNVDCYQTVDGGHGRVETRRYTICDSIDWYQKKDKWPGLQSIAMVESVREVNAVRSYERRHFLTSLEPNAKKFGKACRGHWGIENNLHWTMDVTFREDQSRARSKNAAQNLAALRRLALNMIKNENSKPKVSLRRRRLMAAWNNDYLAKILGI